VIVKPEKIIELPTEIEGLVDEGEFAVDEFVVTAPLPNWAEILAGLKYDDTAVEITRVDIESVVGRELASGGWTTLHSAPGSPDAPPIDAVELSDDAIRDAIKSSVLDDAEDLCDKAGYAIAFKGRVYSALMAHLRQKFLGTSLGLAERNDLLYAFKMLPQVRRRVAEIPGLVAGIIEYGAE